MSTRTVTDRDALAAELARLVPAGADIQVAGESGRCARLRAKLTAEEVLLGAAQADLLLAGEAAQSRIWTGGEVHVLHFAVEDAERTVLERADVLLRLVRLDVAPAHRGEQHACDHAGSVIPSLAAERNADVRPIPVRVVEVGQHELELIAERCYAAGEELDLRFDDGTGGRIVCRLRVQRTAGPMYGRTRHDCRVIAISETDGRRYDHLVSRLALAARPLLVEEDAAPRRGLRRILRRAS